MARKSRTDTELVVASEDLYYEYAMMCGVAALLANPNLPESVTNNALLESFAVHARSLLQFLYIDKPFRDDDVVAVDFVPNWPNGRIARTSLLETVDFRVGKEVAHLTYSRANVKPECKSWHHKMISDEIRDTFRVFLSRVPDRLLGPSWDDYKAHHRPVA